MRFAQAATRSSCRSRRRGDTTSTGQGTRRSNAFGVCARSRPRRAVATGPVAIRQTSVISATRAIASAGLRTVEPAPAWRRCRCLSGAPPARGRGRYGRPHRRAEDRNHGRRSARSGARQRLPALLVHQLRRRGSASRTPRSRQGRASLWCRYVFYLLLGSASMSLAEPEVKVTAGPLRTPEGWDHGWGRPAGAGARLRDQVPRPGRVRLGLAAQLCTWTCSRFDWPAVSTSASAPGSPSA